MCCACSGSASPSFVRRLRFTSLWETKDLMLVMELPIPRTAVPTGSFQALRRTDQGRKETGQSGQCCWPSSPKLPGPLGETARDCGQGLVV